MNNTDAIARLGKQKETAQMLLGRPKGSEEFTKWRRNTEVAIEKIFGNDTRHLKDFKGVKYTLSMCSSLTPPSEWEEAYQKGLKQSIAILESFIEEIEEYGNDDEHVRQEEDSAYANIERIIHRFHAVAEQLKYRRSNRNTLEIADEYDVQYLFHALLKLHFDDIRPEEYTPSYAGASSRVDFLLKQEKIVIEIKKTRNGLGEKEIGEQLIIDSSRYRSHPDCGRLVCFVYDPENLLRNPRGIEHDLTQELNGVPISVFVVPFV